jgi:hypothetical protein
VCPFLWELNKWTHKNFVAIFLHWKKVGQNQKSHQHWSHLCGFLWAKWVWFPIGSIYMGLCECLYYEGMIIKGLAWEASKYINQNLMWGMPINSKGLIIICKGLCHHRGKGLSFTTCEEFGMFLQCQELCVNCFPCSPM